MNCLKARNKMTIPFQEFVVVPIRGNNVCARFHVSQLGSTLLDDSAGGDYGVNVSRMPDEAPKHIPVLLHWQRAKNRRKGIG